MSKDKHNSKEEGEWTSSDSESANKSDASSLKESLFDHKLSEKMDKPRLKFPKDRDEEDSGEIISQIAKKRKLKGSVKSKKVQQNKPHELVVNESRRLEEDMNLQLNGSKSKDKNLVSFKN